VTRRAAGRLGREHPWAQGTEPPIPTPTPTPDLPGIGGGAPTPDLPESGVHPHPRFKSESGVPCPGWAHTAAAWDGA
jgi:hypothetical protein